MLSNYSIQAVGVAVFACAASAVTASEQLEIARVRSITLSKPPEHIALSHDKSTIVASSGNMITTIHRSTQSRKEWKDARNIIDLDVSADGRLVAVATGNTLINVYELRTGKRIQQIHRRDALSFLREDGQQKVSFFPGGKKLASMGEFKRAYISDVKTGDWDYINWVKQPRSTPLVSPDGKFVATVGPPHRYEQSGQLLMFKVRRGLQPLWTGRHTGDKPATLVAFSPKVKRIASGGAGDGVRVWQVESGKQVAHLQMKSDQPLVGVCFVSGQNLILMVSSNELQLRAINSDNTLARYELKKPIQAFAASPDGGNFITSGADSEVQVWPIENK